MPKISTPSSPTFSLLNAAAELIPVIQSGLADTKLSRERAASMAAFIEWATTSEPENSAEQKLLDELTAGLESLKAALAA